MELFSVSCREQKLTETNMGAWGERVFENDMALDWACRLEEADDLSVIEEAIDAALAPFDEEDFLDSDVGCEALAACEAIARLKGNVGARTSGTEMVDKWVAAHPLK